MEGAQAQGEPAALDKEKRRREVNGEILAALFIHVGTIGIVGVDAIFGDDEEHRNIKE